MAIDDLPPGVTPADLRAAFDAAGRGPVLIAFSGGGDSTALMHLLAARGFCEVAIVDHGLRPEAREEARACAERAGGLGLYAEIARLHWRDGEKRSQAAMRAKRYAALCDIARRRGARVIALGHTLDDQAETVLIRAEAGSRWRGLAGMARLAPAPLWPEGRGLLLVRPMLGARREDLRIWLRARRQRWLEDPSNQNDAYARVRARRALSENPKHDPVRLARLASLLRRRAAREDRAAAVWLKHAFQLAEEGAARLDPRAAPATLAVQTRALAAALTALSGAAHTPAQPALRRLLFEIAEPSFAGATHHGCRLRPARGAIALERDPGLAARRRGLPAKRSAAPAPPSPDQVRARLSDILFTPP